MSIKGLKGRVAGVLFILLLVACSSATATPLSTPTPTVAPSPTPTVEVTPTTPPIRLPLNEYLVVAIGVQGSLAPITTDFYETLSTIQGDPAQVQAMFIDMIRAVSRAGEEGLNTLAINLPPPEAEGYHGGLITMFLGFQALGDNLAEALESNNPAASQLASSGFLAILQSMGPFTRQAQDLALVALSQAPQDPLTAYLIATTEAQQDFAELTAGFPDQLDQAPDLDFIFSLFEEMGANMEQLQTNWLQIPPPVEVAELHQRQADLIGKNVELNQKLVDANRNQDDAGLAAVESLQLEIAAESARFSTDWNAVMISVLNR